MSTEGPAYRGTLCKAALDAIAADGPRGKAVVAATTAEHVDVIRKAGRLSWVPAAALDGLNATLYRQVGREGYLDFWRRYTIAAVDTPLFGPLFAGAVRIFGLEPGGLMRWLGRAWQATTLGYGRVDCDVAPGRSRIVLADLPPSGRLLTVGLSMHASMIAMLELTKHEGSVDSDDAELASHGRYAMTARWTEPHR